MVIFKYAYYLLKTINLSELNRGLGPGGLNRELALAVSINLPTIDKQKSILSELSLIETEIAKLKEVLNNIPILQQSIIDKYLCSTDPYI